MDKLLFLPRRIIKRKERKMGTNTETRTRFFIVCPMRHPDNGNCQPIGGFCSSVNESICDGLHKAFQKGFEQGIEKLLSSMLGGEDDTERSENGK